MTSNTVLCNTSASNNNPPIDVAWQLWESTFRRTNVDLLSDYVDPVEERHMELRPDDQASIAGKWHKRGNSDLSSTAFDLSLHDQQFWKQIGGDITPTTSSSETRAMRKRKLPDLSHDYDIDSSFLKACRQGAVLIALSQGMQINKPPGLLNDWLEQ